MTVDQTWVNIIREQKNMFMNLGMSPAAVGGKKKELVETIVTNNFEMSGQKAFRWAVKLQRIQRD